MSKGYLILAQNNDIDYVRQAYALALSIKKFQPNINNVSLVTNDSVPDDYRIVFDQIIEIPFGDHAQNSKWKVENRWKLYHATPYEETIVLDADMLILENMERLWKYVNEKYLFFTSSVVDYKNRKIVDTVHRKTFIENNLPNLYSGLYYFKKCDESLQFFKLLEFITYNWQRFYHEFTPKQTQKWYSMDVSISIAAKILGVDDQIINPNSPFIFTHMKPAIQGWDPVPASYLSQTLINFNKQCELYFNNFRQHGIMHYVEDKFLTDEIIRNLHV